MAHISYLWFFTHSNLLMLESCGVHRPPCRGAACLKRPLTRRVGARDDEHERGKLSVRSGQLQTAPSQWRQAVAIQDHYPSTSHVQRLFGAPESLTRRLFVLSRAMTLAGSLACPVAHTLMKTIAKTVANDCVTHKNRRSK